MTIEEILALEVKEALKILCVDTISTTDNYIQTDGITTRTPAEYINEYNGVRKRRLTSVGMREDKMVATFSETDKDENNEPVKNGEKLVKVARIITNLPKKIVTISKAFLFGGDMQFSFKTSDDASEYFREVFEDDLKMKSVFGKFAETVMVETKSAIVFYPVVIEGAAGKEVVIRAKVLSNKTSEFYPHFDDYGDMDAFTRKYKAVHIDGKTHEFCWIQTATKEYTYVSMDGNWEPMPTKPNLAGKITVVYAEQDKPEWEDATPSIDGLEMRISRLVDTNDYFSEPILKSYGATNLPTRETVGKQIEFDTYTDPDTGKTEHGDADYLTWQQSVDSIKLELDTHRAEIHSGTSTPDLSFNNLKSIGNITGVGLKLMFLDSFIKATDKMEIFGPVVQRSVSVVKALIGGASQTKYKNALEANRIQVHFRSVLPDDLKELFDILKAANGDKPINSQETITAMSPFTKDTQAEMQRLEAEAQAESSRTSLVGSIVDTPPPPTN